MESEQATPVDSIKDVVSKFLWRFSSSTNNLKKARGHIGRNIVENNNKDEDNSPKNP